MAGRNLVVCFDGTNNEFGKEHTNVIRLVQVIDRDPARQRLYYDAGVGTLPETGFFLPAVKTVSCWLGLGFGLGFSRKVKDAYAYLMDVWEPGDRVFLFGFSRGAYAARVLAGMLHAMGLLPRGNHNMIPYTLRYFQRMEGQHDTQHKVSADWRAFCDQFRRTFARPFESGDDSRHFRVHFLGVWDTVSSVGWVVDPKNFPHTAWNPSIEHFRHAVSIDERRAFFRQNLFNPAKGQDAMELWFAGVHCDVGGGYERENGRLWWEPFWWMLGEAEKEGLLIDMQRKTEALANPPLQPWCEPINNSLTPAWYLGEVWPKMTWNAKLKTRAPRLNFARRRYIPDNAILHDSVSERIQDPKLGYQPHNIPRSVR
jgi:uncharacterized protein (DUF2235 family)